MRTPGVINVYCEEPWYVAQPEPEEEFVGTLEAMQTCHRPWQPTVIGLFAANRRR
jgi:hypothetical protein